MTPQRDKNGRFKPSPKVSTTKASTYKILEPQVIKKPPVATMITNSIKGIGIMLYLLFLLMWMAVGLYSLLTYKWDFSIPVTIINQNKDK